MTSQQTSQHRLTSRGSSVIAPASARLLCVLLSFALLASLPAPVLAEYVYLDPGHGGRYPGAVYGGTSEAAVNLLIALEVRAALAAAGHTVGMTRDGNVTVGPAARPAWHWDEDRVRIRYCDATCDHDAPISDLQARVDKANMAGADLFISIHNNAAGSAASGTEAYSNWDNPTDLELSSRLASFVQQEVVRSAGSRDRGTYGVGFYVVRWANMPAILLEVGFLSNPTERALLLTPSYRLQVARGIATGVQRFLATDPFQPLYPRVSGSTRYGTAAEVARAGWPDGADRVYIASGVNWPDSLAVTPLAAATDGPILLARPSEIPSETMDALAELAPSEVILVGGEGALSPSVATDAGVALGLGPESVRRIAGPDRYATAAAIAEELGVGDEGTVYVAAGRTYPDALSIAAHAGVTGAPILMTLVDTIPGSTLDFVQRHAEDIESVVAVGGTGVVGDDVLARLGEAADAPTSRIAGHDRYTTNLAALSTMRPEGELEPFVARADAFPDALCAGVLAAKMGQPVLLVGPKYLPALTRERLMNDSGRFAGFTIVGGEGAVSPVLEWELQKALRSGQDD